MSVNANSIKACGFTDSQILNAAVNAACREGSRTLTVSAFNESRGEYIWILDEPILLPDDFTLILDNCRLRLDDDAFCNIICNENCHTVLHNNANRQRNIHIRGIGHPVLDGGNYNNYSEHSKDLPKSILNNCSVFLCNVEDFSIEGLYIINHRYWGMCFIHCGNGAVKNIDFKADISCRLDNGGHTTEYLPKDYEHVYLQNSDGIDLRIGCHNILIENISGFTVDDTVAMTALCHKNDVQYKNVDETDDIHDIIVRNIYSYTFCWTGQVRVLAKDGCKVYGISIDNVVNTIDERLPYRGGCSVMIGDDGYVHTCDVKLGDIFNINVSNVHSKAIRAIRLTGPMSFISIQNIFVYNGAETVINADSNTELSNVQIEKIFCGEDSDLDSVINFSGNVSGKVRISDVYCDKTDYLIRNRGTAETIFVNAENVKCRISEKTDETKHYKFWWADKVRNPEMY